MNLPGALRHRTMRGNGHAGFTLVEAMIALSLLSIITGMAWSFYLFANKQVTLRERKAFEFDNAVSLLESVAANVRECRATLSISPEQWAFLTHNGDTASYTFTDGKLYFNRLALTVAGKPIGAFSFDCSGNDSLLDANGDREITFNELDLNGDGKLDGREIENLAWIKASINVRAGADDNLSVVEAVKNNLDYDEEGNKTYF